MRTDSALSLSNRTIVITRPAEQANSLRKKLEELGAETILLPTIRIEPVENCSEIDRAVAELSSYDWVIFTSVNGVRFFQQRLELLARNKDEVASTRFCAIGPATARALTEAGFRVDLVPSEYLSEGIVKEIGDVNGQRILLPRADLASDVLPNGLRNKGAVVHQVVTYRTLPDRLSGKFVERLFASRIDAVILTSSSTVTYFVRLLGGDHARRLTDSAAVICIGPITARAAAANGFKVTAIAGEHTEDGLINAIMEVLSRVEK